MIYKLIRMFYYKIISANKVAKLQGVNFGDNCQFGTKSFGSEPYLITVGNNVKTSSGVKFITHDGSVHVLRNIYPELKDIDFLQPIKIDNNIFIGLNAIILPGTHIKDNTIIGAGSIVKGKLRPNAVYAGVPAKFICSIDEYKQKNHTYFVHTKYLTKNEKKVQLYKIFNITKIGQDH